MKTEVIMKRELFGCQISQKSKTEFFSATDLVKAGNKFRAINGMPLFNMNEWFRNKSVKEFISSLEDNFGKVKVNSRGKNQHTWVHPYLFIDLALAIDPNLKIEVYGWLFDYLIRYRNDSGDSYVKMCGALYRNTTKKSSFTKNIQKLAGLIKAQCGVSNWQSATEDQLKLRDRIQENIALLCDVLRDTNQAVKLGITKAIEVDEGITKGSRNAEANKQTHD